MLIEGNKYRTTVRFDKKQADFIKDLVKKRKADDKKLMAALKKSKVKPMVKYSVSESSVIALLVKLAQEVIEKKKRK